MNLGGITVNVLCKILQDVKRLESFAFTSSSDITFDFSRLNRGSLHKLIIHDDSESQRDLGHLIGFENRDRNLLSKAYHGASSD